MENEGELEQIELYLEGKLPEKEVLAFNKKLETDPEFAKKVEEYQNLVEGIDAYGRDSFLNQVHGWEEELAALEAQEDKIKVISWKSYLKWAAVVLLLLLPLGYWLIFHNMPAYTNQELFAEYFEPYDDLTTNRSAEADATLAQGMALYNQGNYAEAISYLEKYKESRADDENEPAVNFYLGVSYLAVGQTEKAKQSFQKVIAHGDSIFVEVAEWNLVLSFLKAEERFEAKNQLRQILKNENHAYHTQAMDLYEKIE